MVRSESLWTAAQIRRIQRYREIEARWSQRTEREREMLRWMAQGLSNKEIARQLGLTPRTVDFHVGNILQKLGVVSRLEAVLWAKAHGFLGPVETYRFEPGNFYSRQRARNRLP